MIISDLNHVEVVSEETETRIVGGTSSTFSYTVSGNALPAAFAGAHGRGISTSTWRTSIIIGPGFGSSSSSSSSRTLFFK